MSLITQDDDFGRMSRRSILEEFTKKGICLDVDEMIPFVSDENKTHEILSKIKNQGLL